MSLRRNDSSTAFFSHWLSFHWPFACGSATRASPLSSMSSANSTASRTSPLVEALTVSRASKAVFSVVSRAERDIVFLGNLDGEKLRAFRLICELPAFFGGNCRGGQGAGDQDFANFARNPVRSSVT